MYEIHSYVFRTCNFFFTQTKIVVLINRPRGNPSRAPRWAIATRQAIASMASDGRHPCRQKRSPSGPPCSHHEDMTRLFFFVAVVILRLRWHKNRRPHKSFFLIFQIETRAGGCGARATEASADRGLLSRRRYSSCIRMRSSAWPVKC